LHQFDAAIKKPSLIAGFFYGLLKSNAFVWEV
jgi:hypothetical protein